MIPWQPTPPPTSAPTGTTVERLCGQPLQNAGGRGGTARTGNDALRGAGRLDAARSGSSRVSTEATACASSSPTGETSGRPSRSRLPETGTVLRASWRMPRSCVSTKGRFSSTTTTWSTEPAKSTTVLVTNGYVIPSLRMRRPRASSWSRRTPSSARAWTTSKYVLPAHTTPSRPRGPPTMRFRPCRSAKCSAAASRSTATSASWSGIWCGPIVRSGSWRQGRSPRSKTGSAGGPNRSRSATTLPVPSATEVTTLNPTQHPARRERRNAWIPRSMTSCWSPGYTTGMHASMNVYWLSQVSVDDLAVGSSPQRSSTPPFGPEPMALPCFKASPDRSRPGAFPYQTPTTPSTPR